ncbi:hypothetical protein GF324_11540, partial [bacterium]|nr:hypothetical protein [bacterium]
MPIEISSSERNRLRERINDVTGRHSRRLRLHVSAQDPMDILRGDVFRLAGRDYLIRGNMKEPRFGLEDQIKYWVFRAIDLESGETKILKTVFEEEFNVHISLLKIRCYRSPEKESGVLDLTHGDDRFMQGFTVHDENGENVRVIDFIPGQSLFAGIPNPNQSHLEYYEQDLPHVLAKLYPCLLAIEHLHDHDLCHGDIRNDHILIESHSHVFRWIDFDLKQDIHDFDLWSLGNVLNYVVAKGIVSFKAVQRGDGFPAGAADDLRQEDGSAFYPYRIMNLRKVYPYIGPTLEKMFLHFTLRPKAFYADMRQFIFDFEDVLVEEFGVEPPQAVE